MLSQFKHRVHDFSLSSFLIDVNALVVEANEGDDVGVLKLLEGCALLFKMANVRVVRFCLVVDFYCESVACFVVELHSQHSKG